MRQNVLLCLLKVPFSERPVYPDGIHATEAANELRQWKLSRDNSAVLAEKVLEVMWSMTESLDVIQ